MFSPTCSLDRQRRKEEAAVTEEGRTRRRRETQPPPQQQPQGQIGHSGRKGSSSSSSGRSRTAAKVASACSRRCLPTEYRHSPRCGRVPWGTTVWSTNDAEGLAVDGRLASLMALKRIVVRPIVLWPLGVRRVLSRPGPGGRLAVARRPAGTGVALAAGTGAPSSSNNEPLVRPAARDYTYKGQQPVHSAASTGMFFQRFFSFLFQYVGRK